MLLRLAETSGCPATATTATAGRSAALGGAIHQIGGRMVSEGKDILGGFDLVPAVKNGRFRRPRERTDQLAEIIREWSLRGKTFKLITYIYI